MCVISKSRWTLSEPIFEDPGKQAFAETLREDDHSLRGLKAIQSESAFPGQSK